MQQLSFEILLNSTVLAEDEIRLTKQAWQIFRLFYSNGRVNPAVVTTGRLRAMAGQYNARLSEIRRALIPLGWCIDEFHAVGGNNIYKMAPVETSRYCRDRPEKVEELRHGFSGQTQRN